MLVCTTEQLTYLIRKAMFEVHNELGPGLLESVYEEALMVELQSMGLKAECQQHLPVYYKGIKLNTEFRIDIIVNDTVIVELKSVERLEKVHFKQLMNYLRLKGLRVGLLVNFNCASLDKDNFRHVVNGY